MSIIITNISEEYKKTGLQEYSLRVNNKELVRFKHRGEDGLNVCLLKAACAYMESYGPRLSTFREWIDYASDTRKDLLTYEEKAILELFQEEDK